MDKYYLFYFYIKIYKKFKIPEIAQSVPNILPGIVIGVISPYPTAI